MAVIGKKVVGKRGRFEGGGPITYPVGAAVASGQVVTGGSGGTAGTMIPGTLNCQPAGIATTSAAPAGTQSGTDPWGRPLFYTDMPDTSVAVARKGAFYLAALGTIAFLDFVKAGANGGVLKWDPAADQANAKVGQCIDTDGATNGVPVLVDVNIG